MRAPAKESHVVERKYLALMAGCLLAIPLAGCTSSQVDTVAVSPATQSVAVGQAAQFSAAASTSHGTHPSSTTNVTDSVIWTSSAPAVATISASGLATGVSAGATTITATMPGYTGEISSTAVLTVTGTGGAGNPGNADITTITVIPGSQSVASPNQTSQFIAIGATASGATADLSNLVQWTSSSPTIATINSKGLATGLSQGTATITALYTNTDQSIANGSASFQVLGSAAEQYTAVTLTPNTQSISASAQTAQFIALATSGASGLQMDVTDSPSITWTSSLPSVATISSGKAKGNGVVTGVSQGNTTITAELRNSDGSIVSNSAAVTVTLTAPPEPLLSLAIVPAAISVGNLQDTGQFLAIGTFSTPPYVKDVTNDVNTTWISSWPDVFPVDNSSGSSGSTGTFGGIVTAYGSGSATIIAEYKDPTDGTIQTATATFNCPLVLPDPALDVAGSCYPGSQVPALKATVTVYNEGLNTTNWLVTAPSATGTPDVIHCGPGWKGSGGSVCSAPYPVGTTVLIAAPAKANVNFGGWSYTCTPSDANGNPLPGPVLYTAAGPNYCTVTTSATNPNVTVGAIFN
ncbi:MAG: Ig-like domain-containing protein [Terracidiphilus sp.]